MNIAELREILAVLPENALVVMSKDAEGNNFSPLSSYSDDLRYNANSTWSGEVTSEENCAEHRADYGLKGPCDHTDCRYGEGVPAVVLWPVN